MQDRFRRAAEAFGRLMDLPADRRAAVLERMRSEDAELAREVERLLKRDRETGFLDTPALGARADLWAQRLERELEEDLSGEIAGRYRLLRKIAAGGMGTVYLAERSDGEFEQQVAVKLIKRGLDTDEVLRRFQEERQTLASLDHPAIARLLDGGATESGRPYVVMEFVDGVPIDRYCRERELPLDERLALFEQVCDAVQYAHSRLVIHRDLKPQNVLVTNDGRPKLVDFGVAKVLTGRGDETGLTLGAGTRFTPEYASPEQVRGEPVTTATDVYSLGVLLYELVAERPPYTLETRSPAELRERICVQDAPLLGSVRPEARGDLERVVALAMRKDPAERYATAREFRDDLQRYRRGQPVIARAPTWGYVAAKFVRRNRAAVAAAVAVAVSLGVLGAVTVVKGREAARQRDIAVAAREKAVEQEREAARQRDIAVAARERAEAVTAFMTRAVEQAAPEHAEAGLTMREFLDASAERAEEELAERPGVLATVRDVTARTYVALGALEAAEPLLAEALAYYEADPEENRGALVDALLTQGKLRFGQKKFAEAEDSLRRAEELASRYFGPRSAEVGNVLGSLGPVLRNQGKVEEAEQVLTKSLEIRREAIGADSAEVAETLNNLSFIAFARQDIAKAEKLLREALEIRRKRLPEGHPMRAQAADNLAVVLMNQRKVDEAWPLLEESLASARKRYPEGHPSLSFHLNNSGGALVMLQRFAEAEPLCREAVEIRRKHFGELDRNTLNAASTLAYALAGQGKVEEGERVLMEYWERVKEKPDSPEWKQVRGFLENFYGRAGNTQRQEEFRVMGAPSPEAG